MDPAQTSPTVPYQYRPVQGPGNTGAMPDPYATPSEQPPMLPRGTPGSGGAGAPHGPVPPDENPFDDVLDRVERDWGTALDDGQPSPDTRASGNPRATPFADHVLTSRSMDPWHGLIDQLGQRLGVPGDVGRALVQTVSGGRPDYEAGGGRAVGLAGVPVDLAPGVDLRDPTANLTTAFARLRSAHDHLGDWDKAALSVTGFGDHQGRPRVVGAGVDGFGFLDRFKAARQQHAPRTSPGYEEE